MGGELVFGAFGGEGGECDGVMFFSAAVHCGLRLWRYFLILVHSNVSLCKLLR